MAAKNTIGFSSGVCWKHINPVSVEILEFLNRIDGNAIELNLSSVERLESAKKHAADFIPLLKKFEYISIHAPSMDVDIERKIALLQELVKTFNANTVTVHPDTVEDWEKLSASELPIAIENMDAQKNSFKQAQELIPILEKYSFGFVYDVNHIMTNDETLSMAKDFHKLFKYLSHIHFSGMKTYDGFKNHFPAYLQNQTNLVELVPLDIPIIIESVFLQDYENQAQNEIQFIRSNLHKTTE